MRYTLLFLIFLLTQCTPLSKAPNHMIKKTVTSNNSINKKERSTKDSQTLLQTTLPKKITQTKECNQSAVKTFPTEIFPIGLKSQKLSERTTKKLEEISKKEGTIYCSENCRQENTYKVSVKIAPASSIPGSCPSSESKEVYSFQKTFTPSADSKVSAKKKIFKKTPKNQMTDWILNTFVYPYIPGRNFAPTKEFHSHKTGEACPSCSFYFDYNYFYESKNRLKLDITVKCGDKKKGFKSRIAKLQIQNHWKCLPMP